MIGFNLDNVIFREAKKQALIYAVVFGFSQAVIFIMYAGAFRFGAYLIEIGDLTASDVYRVFFALAFCAASVGQSSAYLQDFTKAKMAAGLMFQLIHAKPEIDSGPDYGSKPVNLNKKSTFQSFLIIKDRFKSVLVSGDSRQAQFQ